MPAAQRFHQFPSTNAIRFWYVQRESSKENCIEYDTTRKSYGNWGP